MLKIPLNMIANLLGIEAEELTHVTGFQIDSRRIEAGNLFFALPGERTDGHQFLAQVKERGGAAAVVLKGYQGADYGLVLLPVDDVVEALQNLARHFVEKGKAKIVAITGSMGKTTTKDFTATLLEGKFKVGKTYSSYNTRLTLPLTILNQSGDEEILVLEMGMGERGDIAKLVSIAPPDVAVLTKVGMAHYGDLFPNLEEIAKAKGEIFSHPKTKKGIVYHGFSALEIPYEKITFSLTERNADYVLVDDFVDERGVRGRRFDLPFSQPHIRYNFLCALAVARSFGMEWEEIEAQIPKLQLPKMRFQQMEIEGVLWINDAYNANPESTMAALSCLPEPKLGGKKIAVLGRMVGLGPFSRSAHEEVGRFALNTVDHLLTYAKEAIPLCDTFAEGKKPAEHFEEMSLLSLRLKELIRAGDVVLVKGSRDLEMERLVQ